MSRRGFLLRAWILLGGSVAAAQRVFAQPPTHPLSEAQLRQVRTVAQPIEPSPTNLPTATAPPSATPVPPTEVPPTATATPTALPPQIARPAMIPRSEWALPPLEGQYVPHELRFITLHHEGVIFNDYGAKAVEYLRSVQRWGTKNNGWEDIPYHFILDLDGNIYEGRPLWAEGDTGTSYNLTGHALISVLGHYDHQTPSQAQLDSIVALMAWLAHDYQIPLENIKGHKDYIPVNSQGLHIDVGNIKITCPGDNLYAYLESGDLVMQVKAKLSP